MMECLKEEFINEMKNILGERTKNGACVFCKKPLTQGEYCTCNEAKKVNRYFKKCFRLVSAYNDRIVMGDTLEEAREQMKITYKIRLFFRKCGSKFYLREKPCFNRRLRHGENNA